MNNKWKNDLISGTVLLAVFVLWTYLIINIDVHSAGPNGSEVGFASLNVCFHRLTGVNMTLYGVTDWLGLVPLAVCICFGILGFRQLIKRRSIKRVDPDIILLGAYYVVVIICYLVFEMVPLNYRPVLIDGILEASYPSSTVLLVLSVMPTLIFQTDRRCGNTVLRKAIRFSAILFSLFMVIGRLISGVHWATDIAGSVFLSIGLFMIYRSAVLKTDRTDKKPERS